MKDGETTRSRILEEAMKDFAKYGFDGARMERIAGAVGINKASMYFHFKGKEEVFCRLFDEIVGKYRNFVVSLLKSSEQLSAESRLQKIYAGYLKYHWDNPETDFWNKVYYFPPESMRTTVYQKTAEDKDLFVEKLTDVFEQGIREGVFEGSPSSMAETFYYLLTCIALSSDMMTYDEALKSMERCFTVFLAGIGKR